MPANEPPAHPEYPKGLRRPRIQTDSRYYRPELATQRHPLRDHRCDDLNAGQVRQVGPTK